MADVAQPHAARGRERARIEVGYPTVQQSALISPCRPANVPQDHLEGVLLDHLRRLPAAQVRLGCSSRTSDGTARDTGPCCGIRNPARSTSNGPRSCSARMAHTATSAPCWASPCPPAEVTTKR